MTKDCRDETDIAPKPRPCCDTQPTTPGVAAISVDRGNLQRNKLMADAGKSTVLPAIVIRRDGRRVLATRVILEGATTILQDDKRTPAVWIECTGEVQAFVGDKKLEII